MDASTKRAIDALTQELLKTQSELATVKRASRRPQLGHSSIESGSLDVVDPETGRVRLRLGYQPDGSVGAIPEGGDPPPAPSTPIVAPAPVGLMVQWDGQLANGLALPSDFDHVSVHVSEQSGFTPTQVTFQGTIPRAGGLFPVVPLEVGETYYVLLVPVGTGGVEGAPSVEVPGVPDSVGGVPGPGSITETEIADDAISTPKIRALAVQAYHIVAAAIEAGHIVAGAVEASKLAATIVLSTRIVAGDPMAARVELDENGLRGYNTDDALIFAIDDAGNAVFSGDIFGSEISGSRFTMGTGSLTGVIEADGASVFQRVQSGNRQAQLAANATQANFVALSNNSVSDGPLAGFSASSTQVQFALDSSADPADEMPAVTGVASGASAELTTWAERNNLDAPYSVIGAVAGQAVTIWNAPGGGQVRVAADGSTASVRMAGPSAASSTSKWARLLGAAGTDSSRALSIRSPEQDGDALWSGMTMESAGPARAYTRVNYYADEHQIRPGVDGSTIRPSGVLRLDNTVSLFGALHAPVRTDMAAQPTADGNGNFIDFTSGQMPPRTFTTGASGRVRVTIQMCGINNTTNTSTIALGFRLAGGSTVPGALTRAAMVRSMGAGSPVSSGRQQCAVIYLDLVANTAYTLTPMWRISGSSSWGTGQLFDLAYQNSLILENLM